MNAKQAKAAASLWAAEYQKASGPAGIYLSGSIVGMPDEALLPPTSDVDITVVLESPDPPLKLGKFVYQGALLEVSYLSRESLSCPEKVLSTYELAGSFRENTILSDPDGSLAALQTQVSARFREERWVRARCTAALEKIKRGLAQDNPDAPYPDRVNAWLFPTGITTHVILAAACKNPTVRLRYLAARRALAELGLSHFYQELLELAGCSAFTSTQVRRHLQNLARTFDAAAAAAKTPFFFSSDITPHARPIAIDGSRALIEAGDHREAVFWIAATYARCHQILAADAPDLIPALLPDFEALMADLGLASPPDFAPARQRTLDFLPRLEAMADAVIAAGPRIKR